MSQVNIPTTTRIARPGPGQRIAVTELESSQFTLNFDPQEATHHRDGDDLLMQFPDEASISFTGYFSEGNEAPLGLMDGGFYSSEVYLSESMIDVDEEKLVEKETHNHTWEDLLLYLGIDRLGGLDVAFDGDRDEEEHLEGWGRRGHDGGLIAGLKPSPPVDPTGPPNPIEPPEPGEYSWNISFASQVYEDDQPHQDDFFKRDLGLMEPGRINFDFSASTGVTILSITLWDFTEGSTLWLGNPNEGGILLQPNADGSYTFSYQEFMNKGVFYRPPLDCDKDMNVQYEIALSTPEGNATASGNFTIIVDAVADKPDSVVVTPNDHTVSGSFTVTDNEVEERFSNGWAGKDLAIGEDQLSDVAMRLTIPVQLQAQFYDFDGSETHYFYLQVPEGEWSCLINGQAMTIVTNVPGYEGQAFFLIPESYIRFDDNGVGTADIILTSSNSDGSFILDSQINLRLLAVAEEHPTDEELNWDNNIAITEAEAGVTIGTIQSGLNIQVGWASEGGDGSKHGAAYDPNASASSYASATNDGQYALINIGLTGNTQEVITQITITYDASLGTLVDANGNPLSSATNGMVTITLGSGYLSADGKSLLAGAVKFQPRPGVSDDDLTDALAFKVTVQSPEGVTAEFTGTSTVVIDAVADMPDLLGSDISYGNYRGTTGGATVELSGSAQFYDLDGSEYLYVAITIPHPCTIPEMSSHLLNAQALEAYWRSQGNMPAVGSDGALDAAMQRVMSIVGNGRYVLIEYDPATGETVIYGMEPVTGEVQALNIPGVEISFVNGVLTYTIPVQVADVDENTSFEVETHAVTVEKADNDREYDYSNNIAISDDPDRSSIDVFVLTGRLSFSLVMHEDGQANQYLLGDGQDPATGNRDSSYEAGYNAATGMPITMDFSGGNPGEYVSSITIGALPDASQGIIYYNGVALTTGQVLNNPDLTKFSFKPAENFSGDVNFTFSYTISSTEYGPGSEEDSTTGTLHVDSVADLADASSTGGGRVNGEETYATQDKGYESGWAKQEMAAEQSVDITFTITATFYDLDGSERGYIDILLPEGFSLPEGSGYQLISEGGKTYVRVKAISAEEMANSDGSFTVPVTLTMDTNATQGTKTLTIRVVSEEIDSRNSNGHSDSNNTATREITQDVDVDLFPGDLTVKTGWAYEGNKTGGTATSDVSTLGLDGASTSDYGAPIIFSLASGSVDSGTITVDASMGTLYYNGVPLTHANGVYTLTATQLTDGKLTFRPADGYTDGDINLSYSLVVKNGAGTSYTVTGQTTVVIDAVADAGLIAGEVTAVANDDVYLLVTLNDVTFPDTDGSERHYILVEALEGWQCMDPNAVVITVYYDASGNVLTPTGVDAQGNYTYDLSQMASSKQYFRIDVTDKSGEGTQSYSVTLLPPDDATDVILSTGTLAEERLPEGSSGKEYDLANNQAWNFKDVPVNFADGVGQVTGTGTYEDNQPNQHQGIYDQDNTGGVITFKVLYDTSGPVGEAEYINNAAGQTITVTFTYDGQGEPGTFIYNGVTYTATLVEGNTYTLILPADVLANNSEEFSFRYVPPANDDTDLTNIEIRVPTKTEYSGFTHTAVGSLDRLVVDAVADKPVDLSATPDYGDYTAVASGGEVELNLTVKFDDYLDGSESHYLVFDLTSGFADIDLSSFPDGYTWRTLTTAELNELGLKDYADGSKYMVIEVPANYLKDNNGVVNINITATVKEVGWDHQSVELKFAAVAVDSPSDSELRTDNNIAITDGSVEVPVYAVTSVPKLTVDTAYENANRVAHIGGNEFSLAGLTISGMQAGEVLNILHIDYDGSAGSFWYDGAELAPGSSITDGNVTITCTDLGNGTYRISYTGSNPNVDVCSSVGKTGFAPAHNYSDLDVDLTLSGTVVDTACGLSKDFDGKTTIIVDAVAQLPEDMYSSVTYEDGYTAASDMVRLTVGATFHDTDGSETHYLLIEYKDWMDISGERIIVRYDENGNVLTPNANGTLFYYQDPVTGEDVWSIPTSSKIFYVFEVDSYIDMFDVNGADSQTFNDFTVTRNSDGSFTVVYNAEIGVKTGTVKSDINGQEVATGAMAVEGATPPGSSSDGESYQYNNGAYAFDKTEVNIAVVETKSVSVLFGKGFEQDAPNGHVGDYTRAGGAGILVVRETPSASGDYGHEEITVTFTYQAMYQENGEWVLPGTIFYKGVECEYTINPATGLVTVVVTLDTSDTNSIMDLRNISNNPNTQSNQIDGSDLRFVPNYDSYNESDVNLQYTTSVRDTKSGATEASAGAGKGTVIIDAVADMPEISNVAWTYANEGYIASSSAEVTLSFTVFFPDNGTNGEASEGHYILVEQLTGMGPSQDFLDLLESLGYEVLLMPINQHLYYRIPVEYFTENPPGSGMYEIEIPLTLYGDMNDLSDVTTPRVVALAVVEDSRGGEPEISNNVAQKIVEVPTLDFAIVNTYVVGGSSVVYEGDRPNAHIGDMTEAGGVDFDLGLVIGGSLNGGKETVSDITFTYDSTRGTLYYRVEDSNAEGGYRLVEVPNGGTVPAEYSDRLTFIPKDTGHANADTDIDLRYSMTVTDPASGAQKELKGDYTIIVDAVATQPLEVTVLGVNYDGDANGYVQNGQEVTIEISVLFPDFIKCQEGQSEHYILIQKPSEFWTCNYPGATVYTVGDEEYFRIPLTGLTYDDQGRITISVTLKTPDSGYLIYDNAKPIKVGALTVDRDPNKNNNLPNGDQEHTYDNNWAYADMEDIPLTWEVYKDHLFHIDPLYENNTPDGNLLDEFGNPNSDKGGGKVHLSDTVVHTDDKGNVIGTEQVDYVDITWDTSWGDLYVGGVKVTPDSSGTYRIYASEFDNVYFQVKEGVYCDADAPEIKAKFHTKDGNTYEREYAPIVDAVAQVPTDIDAEVGYGAGADGAYTAGQPGNPTAITVCAKFYDLDGSEDLYVLVEAIPGWGNPQGYPVIYAPDGTAYFQIPVDPSDVGWDGRIYTTILLTPPEGGGTDLGDGRLSHTLKVGAMTEENLTRTTDNNGNDRGEETRSDNNTAYNLTGEVEFITSTAESEPVLKVGGAYAGSDVTGNGSPDTDGAANIYIDGLNIDSDSISQVILTYSTENGELWYNDQPLAGQNGVAFQDMGGGVVKLVITNPSIIDSLINGSESNSDVTYVPNTYSDADVSISADITVNDLFSPDSKTVSNDTTIIVDAVARQPEDVSMIIEGINGHSAVPPGTSLTFKVTAFFPDLDEASWDADHYLAFEAVSGWIPESPLPYGVTIESFNGVPYYAIRVDAFLNGATSPALTKNPDGSYTFTLNMTSPNLTEDTTDAATITGGALTVVNPTDRELTLSNNYKLGQEEKTISIAVVETEEVIFNVATITEHDANGSAITLNAATLAALATNNESVTDVTLTLQGDAFKDLAPGTQVATIIYNGVAYAVTANGNGTQASVYIDFGAAGFDPSADFQLIWGTATIDGGGNITVSDWNHTGSDVQIKASATVVDNASGHSKTVDGTSKTDFAGAPDAPTDVNVIGQPSGAVGAGEEVSFTVSAKFFDNDGSENHYILVEQLSGWTGNYSTTTIGGVTYFMVPVSSTTANPTATVTLKTPSNATVDETVNLRTGALAVENGQQEFLAGSGTVNVPLGVVNATGVTLTLWPVPADSPAPMVFALVGGANDSLKSVTINDLKGGVITDAWGNVLFASGPAVLDGTTAANGGYYYKASEAGSYSLSFNAVVQDNASGSTKSFSGTGNVSITPASAPLAAALETDLVPAEEEEEREMDNREEDMAQAAAAPVAASLMEEETIAAPENETTEETQVEDNSVLEETSLTPEETPSSEEDNVQVEETGSGEDGEIPVENGTPNMAQACFLFTPDPDRPDIGPCMTTEQEQLGSSATAALAAGAAMLMADDAMAKEDTNWFDGVTVQPGSLSILPTDMLENDGTTLDALLEENRQSEMETESGQNISLCEYGFCMPQESMDSAVATAYEAWPETAQTWIPMDIGQLDDVFLEQFKLEHTA